jgi:SAM-dependent methyltransferase
MLVDPEAFAVCPYNRLHLVVQYMSALDLRHDDATFDSAYSLSAIEHFGGRDEATAALLEMGRVLKPGGIAAITTECIVNGAAHSSDPGLELFTPEELRELFTSAPGLEPVDEIDLELSPQTKQLPVRPLRQVLDDAAQRHIDYPSVLLEHRGRVYTSAAFFLRRA